MNITEKYETCLHEIANNSSIEIIDYQTRKYEQRYEETLKQLQK